MIQTRLRCQFRVASAVVWLTPTSHVLADHSSAPWKTRDPSVAEPSGQDGPQEPYSDTARIARHAPVAREPAPNALFVEALGPAVVYSLNYERTLFSQVAVRVGLAAWLWGPDSFRNFVVPITITHIGLRGLEAGAGVTLQSDRSPLVSALVGYRLHPQGRTGFQFRAGGLVFVGKDVFRHVGDALPWLYVSVGVGF